MEKETTPTNPDDATNDSNRYEDTLATENAPMQEEIAAWQEQVNDLKDKYVRLMAEFDNYRKRMIKERADLIATAAKDTMAALLPVLDDFDRAQKAEGGFSEGVQLVHAKLVNTLRQQGLKPLEVATGDAFNDEYHEAITEIPAGTALAGKVVDVIEPGYQLNDKIIRFAKVVVGR